MRLVAYVRVSSHDADEATIDNQARAIKRWARANGHRIVQVFKDEGVSGAKPADERPGLTDALRALRDREAVGLIVRDLDRLARSVTVQEAVLAEAWQRKDTKVHTVHGEVMRDDPDDPMRTAMREMVGVFAGLERRMIAKRLRDGRNAKRDKGGHPQGRYRYGWTPKGKDDEQQAALRLMRAMRDAGRSTREIARVLNEQGHPTARDGATWHGSTVARILSHKHNRPANRAGGLMDTASSSFNPEGAG